MADTTIMEVDWSALRTTQERHDDGVVVRVNDQRHVMSEEPTAASSNGLKPDECTAGSWAVRREVVTDEDGAEREVSHYHALRRLS